MQEVRARGGELYVCADGDSVIDAVGVCVSSVCPQTMEDYRRLCIVWPYNFWLITPLYLRGLMLISQEI